MVVMGQLIFKFLVKTLRSRTVAQLKKVSFNIYNYYGDFYTCPEMKFGSLVPFLLNLVLASVL